MTAPDQSARNFVATLVTRGPSTYDFCTRLRLATIAACHRKISVYTRIMATVCSPASCYCTALRVATRRITALYDEALAPMGIGVAQLALLRAVARRGSPTITELSKDIELERSTVGRNAKVLVGKGLLRLAKDTVDLRESTATITDTGQKALKQANAGWTKAQSSIERQLGKDQARQLFVLLQILRNEGN